MIRSFNYCHNRLLAILQVEITEIEKALLELDKRDEANPEMVYRRHSTKHKENEDTTYAELIGELKSKLKEYGKLLA